MKPYIKSIYNPACNARGWPYFDRSDKKIHKNTGDRKGTKTAVRMKGKSEIKREIKLESI